MKDGLRFATVEDIIGDIECKHTRAWEEDPANCMAIYQLLENVIGEPPIYPKDVEFNSKEYEFLKAKGLVNITEFPEELFERYNKVAKRFRELGDKKCDLENGLIVIGRKKRLADLKTIIDAEFEKKQRLSESITVKWDEKHIKVEGNPNRVYFGLNDKGLRVLKDLQWMGDRHKFSYGSESYNDRVKSFREGEVLNFTGFFSELLDRLNSLSDGAAKTLEQITGFSFIRYPHSNQIVEDYGKNAWIKYVRNAPKSKDSYLERNEVPEGYTGFTFDQIDGPTLQEFKKMPYDPSVKIVPQTPAELAQVVKEHKRFNNLSPTYVPKTEDFFYNIGWPDDVRNIPPGEERQAIIAYHKFDPKYLEEIESTFPESKHIVGKAINYVVEERARLRKY